MLGNINDVLEMQAQCRSVAVSRGVNTSRSGNNRKGIGMDFVFYMILVMTGSLLMFALSDSIENIQSKLLRIALRLGMIFALPLVLVVAFFMYVFEVKIKL